MQIKLDELTVSQTYFAMTQTVLPRPIAWLLSENDNGSYNLAPFSYFNAVCSDPPLLMVSIGKQEDGSDKDSIRNVRERPECVIHIASGDQLAPLNQTAARLPPGDSEVDAGGLELIREPGLRLPRLACCKIAFFCERHELRVIGRQRQQSLLFVKIERIHVDDDCIESDDRGRLRIHADRVQPLARLGAGEYALLGEIMSAKRPPS